MTMTPADVENKRFRRGWRGFDRAEVLQFLAEVSEEMLALASRVDELERSGAELGQRLEDLRSRESAIQETLVSVRQMADRILGDSRREAERVRDEARREAELILREARFEGETQIRHAREQAMRVEEEIVGLRVERDTFEDRIRMAADEHLRLLDARREEAEVREKLRVLSLRHGQAAPTLPFTETMRALPGTPDDDDGLPGDAPASRLRTDPGRNPEAN